MNKSMEISWRATASRTADRSSRPRAGLGQWILAAALSVVSIWLFFRPSSAAPPGKDRPEAIAGTDRSCCWVLLDIEAFYCAPCLEPFLDLCRALPAGVQEERVRGILVYAAAAGGESAELRSRIVLKKWQGFRKAHDIRFSAVADKEPFFRKYLKDGIIILLVDEARSVFASYTLPLKPGQLEEIVEAMLNPGEGSGSYSPASGSARPGEIAAGNGIE